MFYYRSKLSGGLPQGARKGESPDLLDPKKAPATREAYRFAVGKFVPPSIGDGGIEAARGFF